MWDDVLQIAVINQRTARRQARISVSTFSTTCSANSFVRSDNSLLKSNYITTRRAQVTARRATGQHFRQRQQGLRAQVVRERRRHIAGLHFDQADFLLVCAGVCIDEDHLIVLPQDLRHFGRELSLEHHVDRVRQRARADRSKAPHPDGRNGAPCALTTWIAQAVVATVHVAVTQDQGSAVVFSPVSDNARSLPGTANRHVGARLACPYVCERSR